MSRTGWGLRVPVKVELDAYVLPDDHTVYKFFPGEGYKFYDAIRDASIAFMDVRGLDELEDDPEDWDDEEVLDLISRDRVDRAVANGEARPKRLVNSPGDKMTQTFLYGLLFYAEKGDLLLMPQKGYTTRVLIGQLLDDAGDIRTVTAKDGGDVYTFYGRRVKWVGGIEKRLFNAELVEQLQTPVAFFDVGASNYEQVYRLAFDNYVYDRQFVATFRTSKKIFNPKDNFLTSVWLELLEVLEEAREGGNSLPENATIYDLVIGSNIDEENRDDLSISVQSPGWFRIRSMVASPLASIALFAMAVQGVPYNDAIAATTAAKIVRQADDTCMGDVDASVRDYIKLLGKDRWEQACKLAKQAEADAKLKADARVKKVQTVAKRKEV